MKIYESTNKELLLALKDHNIEGLKEIQSNDTEAAVEKHIPEVTVEDGKVHAVVGSTIHPMLEAHFISWIALETDKGVQIRYLQPDMSPEATFVLSEGETPKAVYEFCNLHGVWKKEI